MAVSGWIILAIVWNILAGIWNSYVAGNLWGLSKKGYERFISIATLTGGFLGVFYAIILIFAAMGYLPPEILLYANVFLGPLFIMLGITYVVHSIRIYKETKSGWALFFSILNTALTIWNIFAWIQSVRMFTQMGGIKGMMDRDHKNAWVFVIIAVIATVFIVYGFFKLGQKNAEKPIHMAARRKSKAA